MRIINFCRRRKRLTTSGSSEYRVVVGRALPAVDARAPICFTPIRTALHSSLALVKHLAALAAETNRALPALVSASLFHKSPL